MFTSVNGGATLGQNEVQVVLLHHSSSKNIQCLRVLTAEQRQNEKNGNRKKNKIDTQ